MLLVQNLGVIGIRLSQIYPQFFSLTQGLSLHCEPHLNSNGYRVSIDQERLKIEYRSQNDLYKALGDWMTEEIQYDQWISPFLLSDRGLMLDVSRNAVPQLDFLKSFLVKLALLGFNQFTLYTEDLYEVENEPLFGYGRGAYTQSELRELDQFAALLGIEMFPCIQTLGHMEQVLRYAHYAYLQDNPRVFNANLPETYDFIEKLIVHAKAPFKSNKIHLGLDEPWGIGRGKAWDKDPSKLPGQCYVDHLIKVQSICQKHRLSPMIWADYVLGHSGEKSLSEELVQQIPKTLQMVYWDYDSTEAQHYHSRILQFKKLGYLPIAAPTAHVHNRFFPSLSHFQARCNAFWEAMHQENIQKTLLTVWGDDGHECLNQFLMPLLISFASGFSNHCAHDETSLMRRINLLTGWDLEICQHLEKLSNPHSFQLQSAESVFAITPKMLLYDDPLYLFILKMIPQEESLKFIEEWNEQAIFWQQQALLNNQFCLMSCFANFIYQKLVLLCEFRQLYIRNQRIAARDWVQSQKEQLIHSFDQFYACYRSSWLQERKVFGVEIMDARLAIQKNRWILFFDTVKQWSQDKSSEIPEFSENFPSTVSPTDFAFHSRIHTRCFNLWS